MRTHELKLDTQFFDAVLSGEKPFEVKNIIRLGPDDKLNDKELEAFKKYVDAAECAIDKGYTSEDITNIGLYLIRRNGKLYNWERIAETLYRLPAKEVAE